MKLKPVIVSLFVALGLSSALAATKTATFEPVAPGSDRYTLNGFGRTVNSIPDPGAGSSFALLASDPTPFHDRYLLVGLPLGSYALQSTTPVTWSGGIAVSAVTISWLTPPNDYPFIDFYVDSASKTATGTGNFAVNCDKCVWLDVYGTEIAGTPGEYGSPFEVMQVPEPASVALMLVGLAAIGALARRRGSD